MSGRVGFQGLAAGLVLAAGAFGQAYAQAPAAPATDSITNAILSGHLILDLRGRYEFVDQTKTAVLKDDANAYTLRTQIGWETGAWNHFKALLEFQDVAHAGAEDFAVNAPGAATPPLNGASKARFPIVNDPDEVELNRAQINWAPIQEFSATVGRQRILIDDQRFVGNAGWRQNEQTFDAARTEFSVAGLSGTYVYIDKINRVLGPNSDWNSDSHLLNLAYAVAPQLRVEGFVYALDFSNSLVNNSITEGGRITGKLDLGKVSGNKLTLTYGGTYADQRNYRSGAAPHFDLSDYDVNGAAIWGPITGKADYEVLDGNGVRGFTTPLATTHAFNGWADAWASPGGNKSFVDGLKDLNFTAAWRPPVKLPFLFNPELSAIYHTFDDEKTGAHLAQEYDLLATVSVTKNLTGLVKFADFTRQNSVPVGTVAPPASRTKVWVGFEYKL